MTISVLRLFSTDFPRRSGVVLLALFALCHVRSSAAQSSTELRVSPASLTFSGVEGGIDPFPKTLRIETGADGPRNFTVSDNADWLDLDPPADDIPGDVAITVRLSGLRAEGYSAAITVNAPGAGPVVVPVHLQVTPGTSGAGMAGLSVSPQSLAVTARQDQDPGPSTLSIYSNGSPLSWTASTSAGFLSVSPSSGTTPGSILVSFRVLGLLPGTYSGTISISASGGTGINVPVLLTVNRAPGTP